MENTISTRTLPIHRLVTFWPPVVTDGCCTDTLLLMNVVELDAGCVALYVGGG